MPPTQPFRSACRLPKPPEAALPEDLATELGDQLAAIKDVLHAYDLIASLTDPLMRPGNAVPDVDQTQLNALMRILNTTLAARLAAAEGVLAG